MFYMSIPQLILHSKHYYSYMTLKTGKMVSSTWFFFKKKIVLAILVPFSFHINFRTILPILTKILLEFRKDFFKPVHQFGENRHLFYLVSFNTLIQSSLHLCRSSLISLINVVFFSAYKSCTCFLISTLKYLIFLSNFNVRVHMSIANTQTFNW